jgi:fructokinase
VDEVLVVGEALVDIVERRDGTRSEHPGGSPANVALGLARLGRRTGLLTRIGDDERGRRIVAHLQAGGVRLVDGSVTLDPTSTAKATLDERGVASYEFDIDWRLPEGADADGALAVHTGSIGAFLQPGGDQVAAMLARAAGTATISYDPNARPRLMGDATTALSWVQRIVTGCDLVKVSDEDLDWLLPGEQPIDLARRWQQSGPSIVVVTRGEQGAIAAFAAGTVEVPAPSVPVIDTVGAGDAFTAGMLDYLAGAGLLGPDRRPALAAVDGYTVIAMLEQAVRVSAITCTRAGAQPPTRQELDAWVAPSTSG